MPNAQPTVVLSTFHTLIELHQQHPQCYVIKVEEEEVLHLILSVLQSLSDSIDSVIFEKVIRSSNSLALILKFNS